MAAQLRELSLDDIYNVAPSVFADRPHHEVSAKYSFISTADILRAALAEGLVPVAARQSRAKEGHRDFTRHELRLVSRDQLTVARERLVGDSHFQILLTNSHDRGASFKVDAGLHRLACANGLVVPVEGFEAGFRVRHSGDVSDVLEGVFTVVAEQSQVLQRVEEYRALQLPVDAQVAFATAALELRDSTIDLTPAKILRPRRWLDASQENGSLPRADLYTTLNVVQENLIKGGVVGVSQSGRRLRTRQVADIGADQKLNKALFILADALKAQL